MDNGKVTFTKKWMARIMLVALFDIQLPFVLAFLGMDQIAETLGGLIVTEVIGVFLVYCLKSFFETKEAEKNRIEEEKLKREKEEEDDELAGE